MQPYVLTPRDNYRPPLQLGITQLVIPEGLRLAPLPPITKNTRGMDPDGRLYHAGIKAPSSPQPKSLHYLNFYFTYSNSILQPLLLLCLPSSVLSRPVPFPFILLMLIFFNQITIGVIPMLLVVFLVFQGSVHDGSFLTYAAAAAITSPPYSVFIHSSVISVYALPATFTNLNFIFIFVLIPAE